MHVISSPAPLMEIKHYSKFSVNLLHVQSPGRSSPLRGEPEKIIVDVHAATEPTRVMRDSKISVQNDPIDAIVIAARKILIESVQLIRYGIAHYKPTT